MRKKSSFFGVLLLILATLVGNSSLSVAATRPQSAQVSLSGSPTVTGTLFADVEGLPSGSRTSYRWTLNGSAVGSESSLLIGDESWSGAIVKVSIVSKKSGFKDFKYTSPAIKIGGISAIVRPSVSGELFVQEDANLYSECGQYLPVLGSDPGQSSCSVQWKLDGTDIDGETGPALALSSAFIGSHISAEFTITAENAETQTLNVTVPGVVKGKLSVLEDPEITSNNVVGSTVSIDTDPVFSEEPDSISIQWFRDGKKIPRATRSYYTLTAADWHKRITVSTTAYRSSFAPSTSTWEVTTRVYKYLTKTGRAISGWAGYDSCDYANYSSYDCWRHTKTPTWACGYNADNYSDDFIFMNMSLYAPVASDSVASWRVVITGTSSINLLLQPSTDEGAEYVDTDNYSLFRAGTTKWSTKWSTIGPDSDGLFHFAIYGNEYGGFFVKSVQLQVRYLG